MLTQYQVDSERETKRQQALKDVISGIGSMEKDAKTKREQALTVSSDMRKQGYEVTPEMAAKNMEPEQSGIGKWFAQTPIGQSMGMEVQERPDLYTKKDADGKSVRNSTTDWTYNREGEDEKRKFIREDRGFEVTDRDNKRKDIEWEQRHKTATLNKEKGINALDTEKKQLENQKLRNDLAKGPEAAKLPVEKEAFIKNISKKSADTTFIANNLDAFLENSKNYTDEQLITQGNQLIKTINSTLGPDATGVEEVNRLGQNLQFMFGNVFGEGQAQLGRDLPGFKTQVKDTIKQMRDTIAENNNEVERQYGRGAPRAMASANPSNTQLSPINFRGNNPAVAHNPTNTPSINPFQNANAARAVQIKPHHVEKTKQMTDQQLKQYLGIP